MQRFILSIFLCLVASTTMLGQKAFNLDVEGKIELETINEQINVTGTALNKSELNQGIRYVLSINRIDAISGNRTRNEQSGRLVLEEGQKSNLSTVTISALDESRMILLLLIYDDDDKIIGKDRKVINETEENLALQEQQKKVEKQKELANNRDLGVGNRDGVELRGIVVENTKTKPGRDFFGYFTQNYNKYDINSKEVVTVTEVFALGRSTKIEVRVEDIIVWQFFLQPKDQFLRDHGFAAIKAVYQHIKKKQEEGDIIVKY